MAYDLRRTAEVFGTLVERNLRLRNKRASLGVVWPVVAPLVSLVLYVFVFHRILNVPIKDYPEFLFAGLLPWSLVAMGLGGATTSLSAEPELIRRCRFRYELLPMAAIGGLTAYFAITFTGFVAYLAATGRLAYEVAPLIVVPMVALVLFVMGLAVLLALIDVYNRDLRAVLANILTVWFFLLPIVYRQEMLPDRLRVLRSIDPMNLIIGQFRDVLYYGHIGRPGHMALMLTVCAGFFALSIRVFRRYAPNLPGDV
jgi:ABC-type polysaccharide/polyol phosphate export permease